MLDAASPLPLYHQLARWLEGRVQSGELAAGDRIESEPALARQFGIGRPTVRQATEVLVRRGLLERRRGAGTFVRPPAPAVDVFGLGGTLAGFRDSGVPVETRSLGPIAPGEDGLGFTRLHLYRGRPVVLEALRLDDVVFGPLRGRDFEGSSLSRAVRDELGLRLDHAQQSFAVARVDAPQAALLELAPASPVLRVERDLVFGGVGAVARATLLCRTEELRFTQTLHGDER